MYIVTGYAGFIGSHITERLLKSGEKMLGIDDLNDLTDQRLKRWRLDQLRKQSGFNMFKADIANPETVSRIVAEVRDPAAKPAAVLNLAGRAGVLQSVADPQLKFDANVMGTLNMMELCRKLRIPKFVTASSSSVYGNSSVGPTSEDSPTDSPLSPYAASKKDAKVPAHLHRHLSAVALYRLRPPRKT
jgi:UDP-glucuronate 4-epimerase